MGQLPPADQQAGPDTRYGDMDQANYNTFRERPASDPVRGQWPIRECILPSEHNDNFPSSFDHIDIDVNKNENDQIKNNPWPRGRLRLIK